MKTQTVVRTLKATQRILDIYRHTKDESLIGVASTLLDCAIEELDVNDGVFIMPHHESQEMMDLDDLSSFETFGPAKVVTSGDTVSITPIGNEG